MTVALWQDIGIYILYNAYNSSIDNSLYVRRIHTGNRPYKCHECMRRQVASN